MMLFDAAPMNRPRVRGLVDLSRDPAGRGDDKSIGTYWRRLCEAVLRAFAVWAD